MFESVVVSNPVFREGDDVTLARGSYTGTFGKFLHLREDPNWADIAEPDGSVRCHPVQWLELTSSIAKRKATKS